MRRNLALTLLLVITVLSLALSACSGLIPQTANDTPATVAPTETAAPADPTETAAPTEEVVEGPRLRIRNIGEHDIKNLTVLFPESRITIGDVPAGATSEFVAAPNGVYNYGAYEYERDGELVIQPVIDWMGESPRPGEDFTYVIRYNPEVTNMLQVELVEVISE